MKQKYTLMIADTEINVLTDENQEAVDYIVGMLDRKMREIILKSRRCSKNEAALLCALDFCADKVKSKELLDELESELDASESELKILNEKLDAAETRIERLESERVRLEIENGKLTALLEEARERAATSEAAAAPVAEEPVVEESVEDVQETVAEVLEAPTAPATPEEEAAEVAEAKPERAERPVQSKRKHSRNRVGSMFDLLTFSDI